MELLIAAAVAFVTSLWCSGATIKAARVLKFGSDEAEGVQKLHSHWVPRLGGIPIFLAYFSSLLLVAWESDSFERETAFLIICLLPAFLIGLIEDVTRRAGITVRLVFTMVAAALGCWLLGAQLNRIDVPLVDGLLGSYNALSFAFTLVAVAGLAHATNIIDGCNGLSGFVATIVLLCLGVIAVQVGDELVARAAFTGAAAVLGFLFWNFPFGKIFLGDAGAYMVGFVIAELSIMLVMRNPEVSAWFPMLLMAYPVWETLFSMMRRVKLGLSHIGKPDASHLHQLILRRVVRKFIPSHLGQNSATSPYLWSLSLLCAIPAVAFYDATPVLQGACLLFIGSYCWLYGRLVRFRTPSIISGPGRLLSRVPQATPQSAQAGVKP